LGVFTGTRLSLPSSLFVHFPSWPAIPGFIINHSPVRIYIFWYYYTTCALQVLSQWCKHTPETPVLCPGELHGCTIIGGVAAV
jgi:hypothetical protein